jgi:GDPmannose 4,6-dehydratase
MNKKNLIIGTGVLGAYLALDLLKNNEKVIVTSRSKKKNIKNFQFLKIQNQIKFEKLNIKNIKEIEKIIKKYNPNKIFYFAGQSSLTKSNILKKETYISHFIGTKNFLDIIKKNELKCKFFKANSGYIFKPKKGKIDLECNFSNNKNEYIQAQKKTFKLINKFRKFKLNVYNLVFLQIESPLRSNNFFIKKVCIAAKNKKRIVVGNIGTFRDYSWVTEITKSIIITSKLKSNNFIISAGKKISGRKILNIAYSLNKLDYKKYFKIDKKFLRKNEEKVLIGSSKNTKYLNNKLKFKIYGKKLIEKMYKNI